MDMKRLTNTQKLTVSGAVMAIYIVVMYFTQSFAFGQYQVRVATAIYGCAYLFPFLVVPLGLSNLIANMVMGGLGVFDIVGGGLVGLLTAGCCALLGRKRATVWSVVAPIALIAFSFFWFQKKYVLTDERVEDIAARVKASRERGASK